MPDDSALVIAESDADAPFPLLDAAAVLARVDAVAYSWNVAEDRLLWSAGAVALLGVDSAKRIASGTAFRRLVSTRGPLSRESLLTSDDRPGRPEGVPYELRYELSLARGPVGVEDVGRWFPGENGRPARFDGVLRVIDRLGAGARARRAPMDDRQELFEDIGHAFALAKHTGRSFGLFVIGMIGLDTVQDRHGSEVAAEIADEIEQRVGLLVRRADKAYRVAPNRIAVLAARCPEEELGVVASRLVDEVRRVPVATEVGKLPIRLVCGAISAPTHAREARVLLRRAEEALERARRLGRDFVCYEPDRRSEQRRRQEQQLADEVLAALASGRVRIARQPIVRSSDRSVAFHEALIRIERDDGGYLGAGAVVPVFEKLGRVELIDQRVLELSLAALAEERTLSLSVNVAVATLSEGKWLERLAQAIGADPGIAPRIIVEMTESQAIEDETRVREMFTRVRALGARTAIDDFGAGHTSFRHLRGLPVDILKIDGAFVQDVVRSTHDGFFVRTLVELAGHIGVETVAEWVRDEESAALLASWGVDYLQGDFLGPAVVAMGGGEPPRAAAMRPR